MYVYFLLGTPNNSWDSQYNPSHLNLMRIPVKIASNLVEISEITTQSLLLLTLQSDPRDLQPLRHLIRVMKRHDLTEKRPTYQHTYPPTYLPTYVPPLENTLKEQS